jgi:hypothetical protein
VAPRVGWPALGDDEDGLGESSTEALGLGDALSDGPGTTSPSGSIETDPVASGVGSSAPAARAAPPTARAATAPAATAVILRTLFISVPPVRCVLDGTHSRRMRAMAALCDP